MHLIRTYLMGIDILEHKEIHTYRENDLVLLKEIREGNTFYDEEGVPNQKFFDLVEDLRNRMNQSLEQSTLPDTIDKNKVDELLMSINQKCI